MTEKQALAELGAGQAEEGFETGYYFLVVGEAGQGMLELAGVGVHLGVQGSVSGGCVGFGGGEALLEATEAEVLIV